MKNLYTPQNNTDLINTTQQLFNLNEASSSLDNNKDLFLLSSLSMLENENNEEPNDKIIEFLFNYSKSMQVYNGKKSNISCVLVKN